MKGTFTKGFTLLEVLIAISIFALIGMGCFMLLGSVTDTKTTLEQHSKQMANIETFLTLLSRDLAQATALQLGTGELDAVSNPYPDENTKDALLIIKAASPKAAAAFAVFTSGVLYARQTGGGPRNEAGVTRHMLYTTQEAHGPASAREFAIGASELPPVEQQFGDNIQQLKFRLLSSDDIWQEQWPIKPVAARVQTSDKSGEPHEVVSFPLPKVIEVTIGSSMFGEIRRYIELPRGVPTITIEPQEGKGATGS